MGKMLKFVILVVVLLAAAYVAGFWPQRERVSALTSENVALQQRAAAAEDKVRAGAILGELLAFKEVVQEMNYGQARGLSSPFFEHVAAEAARTNDAAVKQALASILAVRDRVTVALTQGDASSLALLREAEGRLRQGLGYPAAAVTAAAATSAPGAMAPATTMPAPIVPPTSDPAAGFAPPSPLPSP
jgi:hypothetical protein